MLPWVQEFKYGHPCGGPGGGHEGTGGAGGFLLRPCPFPAAANSTSTPRAQNCRMRTRCVPTTRASLTSTALGCCAGDQPGRRPGRIATAGGSAAHPGQRPRPDTLPGADKDPAASWGLSFCRGACRGNRERVGRHVLGPRTRVPASPATTGLLLAMPALASESGAALSALTFSK